MGFYIELKKTNDSGTEFIEQNPPPVFWTLYGIAGFALTCMLLAAHTLLTKLLNTGDPFDLFLVGSLFLVVPLYLIIGFKLACVRKYLQFTPDQLVIGYSIGRKKWNTKILRRAEMTEVLLINQKPSSNVAPAHHTDPQYYIRGHWRLILKDKMGKSVTLDKHTEIGALKSLENSTKIWMS
jgi:hypothetical protein